MGVSLDQLTQSIDLVKEYVDERNNASNVIVKNRVQSELIYESEDFVYTSGCDLTPFVKLHSFADGVRPLEHPITDYQMLAIELSISHTVDVDGTPRVMTNTENEFILNPVLTESKDETKTTSIHLFNLSADVITYDKENTSTKYYPIGKVDIIASTGNDNLDVLSYKVTEYENSGNLNHTAKIRVYAVNYLNEPALETVSS